MASIDAGGTSYFFQASFGNLEQLLCLLLTLFDQFFHFAVSTPHIILPGNILFL